VDQGPVCVLTLNRPPVNALNTEMYSEIRQHLAAVEGDSGVRAVVIAADDRLPVFSAGADIKEFDKLFSRETAVAFFRLAHEVLNSVERLPQVTLAAIENPAYGGGAELLLAVDLRVASRNASIGFPEVTIGQFAGTGGTMRLPWLVGESAAREILLTGAQVDPDRALHLNLYHRVVDTGAAAQTAIDWAHELAGSPAMSVRATKQSILSGRHRDAIAATPRDSELSAVVASGADSREGQTAFLEKRRPQFTHDINPMTKEARDS